MTNQEAKSLLQVYRAGGQDADHPQFAAAMEQMRKDPELSKWFQEQCTFDALFVSAVEGIPVPRDLKASLLAAQKTVRLPVWHGWPIRMAAAAVFVTLLALSFFWLKKGGADFGHYRQEIVEASWDHSPHSEQHVKTLAEAQQWLAQQQAPSAFTLPSGLTGSEILGCRVLDWRGQRVSFICFSEGMNHRHLFVIDSPALRNLPTPSAPDFEKCAGWKTISWSHDEKLYVLAGMNYLSFIKKCRKHGQWLMSG